MNADILIDKAIKQIIENKYTPVALWYSKDNTEFIITTRDIDISPKYRLVKKYQYN